MRSSPSKITAPRKWEPLREAGKVIREDHFGEPIMYETAYEGDFLCPACADKYLETKRGGFLGLRRYVIIGGSVLAARCRLCLNLTLSREVQSWKDAYRKGLGL